MSDAPAYVLCDRLVRELGRKTAHRVIDVALEKFSNVELAALATHWEFWARAKQLAPATYWRTWGFLTGRGFGKTLAISKFINGEVEAGRAMLIGLAAQDEANCIAIQVLGPSGLIAQSPPWFKARWEATAMQVVWPNGARAYVRTPEVPGKIRGLEYHLSWICEIQSWPAAHRKEAFDNFKFSTRLGYARIVWDATPKRRHPILKQLLQNALDDPDRHVVIRGAMSENAINLGDDVVRDLEREFKGTTRGREELDGETLDENEDCFVTQAILDLYRKSKPDRFVRKGIGIDPAVTDRAGSDRTGISLSGLGLDGRLYVLGDLSGKYSADAWGELVVATYLAEDCDVCVVETNKGGNLLTQNLRAIAGARDPKIEVVVVDAKWKPQRMSGKLFVREIFSRGEKADRAKPLATAYERGRISHVVGADLVALEDILTTWIPEPGHRSPDPLEALVHVAGELLDLAHTTAKDPKKGFEGVVEAARILKASGDLGQSAQSLSEMFASVVGAGGRGGRL